MSTVAEFLGAVGTVRLAAGVPQICEMVAAEAAVGGENELDLSVEGPSGRKKHWVLFHVRGKHARIAASHARYLYAFWRWLRDDAGDRPVADFARRRRITPSFAWQRPVYDIYFSQSARSVRNLDRETYVREMARAGFTHLEVNSLATPEAYEKGVPGEVYPRFYTYLPALDQFVASTLNRGIYPKRYLAANLARLKDGAERAARYGLEPTLTCFEPRSVPEKLLSKYPELRGCRVDHPFRSFLPRYNLAVGHPAVQEHYRELMTNLMREVPELSCLSVWTNDSGAGMEFTKTLYVGANGSAYLVREWSDDDVFARSAATNATSFLRLLKDAAAETNPDFRVVTRLEPFGVERPFVNEALGNGLDVEVPTLLATGWESPYGHPTYPDSRIGPFTVYNNAFREDEGIMIRALARRDCRTHVMHAHGPTNNFEPLMGIPSPWLVNEKLAAMRAAGVDWLSHFGGIAPPASVPFFPNDDVFRSFQFDPEKPVEGVIRSIAARFAGRGKARSLVAAWRLVEKAIRGFMPNPLYFLWGPWYRLWVRPLVPDIDAIPEKEREYYEKRMLSTHHNPNRVDLSRDVLFHLMDAREAAKAVSRIDRRALPHLARALDRLAGEDAPVFIDLRDRLNALRHWMITRRNVASWIANVKGHLETTGEKKRAAHRKALAGMVSSEIANVKGLRTFLAACETEVMSVSAGEETTFIYDATFDDHLGRKMLRSARSADRSRLHVAGQRPSKRSRPATRAAIFRSATDRLSIQNPQSGLTKAMRSAPRTSVASSMRRAISSGLSTTLVLMSTTPTPNRIRGSTSASASRSARSRRASSRSTWWQRRPDRYGSRPAHAPRWIVWPP